MDQPTAVVVGAAIGAIAAILGGFLTFAFQTRLERERWRREREDSVLGGLTRELASISHSMMWATFKALNQNEVTAATLKAYEEELHEGIASSVGAQMHVAAFQRELYERITPHVSKMIELGGDTYRLLSEASIDFPSNSQKLLARNGQALMFIKTLPKDFADMLRR
jgi:hypothetical protein